MKIGVIREDKEPRVALVPAVVKKFTKIGNIEVLVQKGLTPMFSDKEYTEAGAKLVATKDAVLKAADIIFRLNAPSAVDIAKMKKGSLSVSHMNPYENKTLINAFNKNKVNSISMEMIPRTTLAQKMDSLSSQSSLAGYAAVLVGASEMTKIFPMMTTPAGTIPPAKVFIIGAGVAGLQAIATAKRLGAKVEAFDTRQVVEEQVNSLGAKFVKIDLGETGQDKNGYAKALTPEQLKKQQEAMAKSCINADLVITTAKLFGRKAPVLVTKEIIKKMRPGSVIVDLAAGGGGNVEGTKLDKTVEVNGVKIVGIDNLAGLVPLDSSSMYASNLFNLFTHFYNTEKKELDFNFEDEIISSSVINYDGKLVNERMIKFWEKK